MIPDHTYNDDTLQQLVADMLDCVEPVPAELRALAYQASQLAALNDELAALVYDSTRDGDLVLTRGSEGQARMLSFANDHVSLELSLLPDGVSLVGEIVPVDAHELDIETDDGGSTTVPVDEFGRFRATTEPGAIRLRVAGLLVTPWITR